MSLRARLLAGMALVAFVLAGAAVVITRTTEAHLVEQVDEELVTARPLARGGILDPGPGADQRFSSFFVGVVDGTSVRTVFTPNVTENAPPLPEVSAERAVAAAIDHQPFTVGAAGSNERWRLYARAEGRNRVVLVLGLPLTDVDDAVRRLIVVEIVATAAILAVLALVTSWVIRLGVRPIKQMTDTATAIAGGDLSHRVPDVAPGTEAGELGTALNQMLGRIENAFDERERSAERLRQFVADASHELRTPVTTIRGYAELYRSGGLDDSAELDEAMRRAEQEAVRMGSLIDDLLLLARLDQGRPLEREVVRLDLLAADAVRDARAVQPERTITAEIAEPVEVIGDDGRLRQVLANVVGNALVHTPPSTPVEVRVAARDGTAVLEVADRGPGMPPDVADRAFERFYRADPSRSRHRGGSGLGLSIVDATVTAHGGEVSLHAEIGSGTTVRIELPLRGGTGAAAPAPSA